jgi:hypothetical protein
MVGHSVISPSLFSIKTAGQLGGSSELETAYALFMSNYANERQKIITDAIAYAQYTLNSFVGEVFFVEKPLQLGNVPDSKSIVADSLNKMSPLLANAVLKNLTINEQRALAGLTPLPNGDVLETTQATFNAQISDEVVINWFSEVGRSEYKEVFSREINDFSDLERTEKELLSKHTFADNLTDLQTKILAMINNGESYGAIVKASGESATIVTRNLIELEKLGMIKGFELTPKGQQNTKGVSFEVVYQYRERTDAPKLKEGGESRPFCKSLINLKKVFTREEINGITAKLKANGIDRDVWQYKGGWYTNPNTQVHTPSCRHTFFQVVISK